MVQNVLNISGTQGTLDSNRKASWKNENVFVSHIGIPI